MFERNALRWLREWKNKADRKPLVLRGARQVGKTSLVYSFAKEFDVFMPFNLETPEDASLFEKEMPVNQLFDLMCMVKQVAKKGSMLVFLDEIQNSPYAIKALRYFYEQLPDVYVIAAGSLLETMINTQVSFPVGRVEYMALRPATFCEFLTAIGEQPMRQLVEQMAVPEVLHQKVMTLFNLYTLVGGMPEAVANYAEKRDVVALSAVYQTLIAGYADDVEKYQKDGPMRNVLRLIIQKGWQSAASRITFEHFGNSAYKSREIGEAMRTLQKTMLLELVYPTTDTAVPFAENLKKRPKLLWLDTGLVNYAAGVQSELFGKTDISDAWRGCIAEHIIGQELLATSPLFLNHSRFWVREEKNSQAEIDFLYMSRYDAVPIEVKSGHIAHLKSLQMFMQLSGLRHAVRFWPGPMLTDTITLNNGNSFILHNLPYYYAGQIDKLTNTYFE